MCLILKKGSILHLRFTFEQIKFDTCRYSLQTTQLTYNNIEHEGFENKDSSIGIGTRIVTISQKKTNRASEPRCRSTCNSDTQKVITLDSGIKPIMNTYTLNCHTLPKTVLSESQQVSLGTHSYTILQCFSRISVQNKLRTGCSCEAVQRY